MRAQVERRVGTGQLQLARDRTGGEHELVVAEDVAVGQLDLMAFCVELHRGHAAVQCHVVVGVPLLVVDDRLLERGLALQVVLRQRRTLVGQVGLVGDEIEPARIALITQRLDGLGGGQATTDDDDALGILGHGGTPLLDVVLWVLPGLRRKQKCGSTQRQAAGGCSSTRYVYAELSVGDTEHPSGRHDKLP